MRLICHNRNLVDDFLNCEKSRISSKTCYLEIKKQLKDENEHVEYWA